MAGHKSVPGCEVLSDSGTDMADPHLGLQSPKQPFRGIYYEKYKTHGAQFPLTSVSMTPTGGTASKLILKATELFLNGSLRRRIIN